MTTEKINQVSADNKSAICVERWDRICEMLEKLISHAEECGKESKSRGFDKVFSEISTVSNRMKRILKEMKESALCGRTREDEIITQKKPDSELNAISGKVEAALLLCQTICGEFTRAEANMDIMNRCSEMHEHLRQIEELTRERLKHIRVSTVY